MVNLIEVLSNMVGDIIAAIPAILAAIIIILIGYAIGLVVGRSNKQTNNKLGMERSFDQTIAGRSFRAAGFDLSNFIGGIVTAFITILSIIMAIEVLAVGGTMGAYLASIANYLPRLLGGILIIVFGTVLVDFLATLIGRMIKPMFPESKGEIADMLKNLLFIGLIAFVLLLALDVMLLSGSTIYPLILGFVLIGAGIALTDGLIKSITDDHEEFRAVAGYAKFVLYAIFLIIGTAVYLQRSQGLQT